jgi:hypothetical protein
MGRESGHSRGVKALAIKLGLESKENQMITVGNLWFTIKNGPIILSVLFYRRGLESKENQMITACNLWFTNKNGPIILFVLFYGRDLTPGR